MRFSVDYIDSVGEVCFYQSGQHFRECKQGGVRIHFDVFLVPSVNIFLITLQQKSKILSFGQRRQKYIYQAVVFQEALTLIHGQNCSFVVYIATT